MYSVVRAWFEAQGWPTWLVPDYWVMTGLATTLAFVLTLRVARRDGANEHATLITAVAAYVAAVAGGFVFEWLRVLPVAVATWSFDPFFAVGRAAYGGLLFAALAAYVVQRGYGEPWRAFLDRATPGTALAFGFVRVGCFIAGCDYGTVTASSAGVRFPSDSLAASDHAERGWIMLGSESLPVHATQLYEAAFGFISCLVAWWALRAVRARDGRILAAWVVAYALVRFAIEGLRGDVERGVYGWLSTAQIVSLVIVLGAFIAFVSVRASARGSQPAR